ncbi:hypothetical protein BDR26DRAFT_860930 [Obelidium mucronatum]|nr:hypothetical protein BDR26DRAFT_860930 [Obelidium mucronatum]
MDDEELLRAQPLEDGEQDYEEEDSDEDIEIVMDTEQQKPAAPINIKTGGAAADAQPTAAGAVPGAAAPGGKSGAFDMNLVGQVDGKDLFDLELDSIEDKPWRKPGADITDYFNFGFNETSWRAYCTKQKSLREEAMMQKRIHVFEHNDPSMDQPNFFGAGMMGMQQQKYQRMPQQQQFNPMNMMQMQMMRGMGMGPPGMGMGGMGPPPGMGPPGMGMGPPGMVPPPIGPPGMMGGGGPGGELNAFGKRPREQDDSSIKVIAGGDGGDDKPPGTDGRPDGAGQRQDGPGRYPAPGDFGGGPGAGNGGFQNQQQQNMFRQQQQRGMAPPMRGGRGMPPPGAWNQGDRGGGYYNQGGAGDHADVIPLSGGGVGGGSRGTDQRSPNLQQKQDGPGGGGGYRGPGGDRGGYYGGGREHDRYHDDKRGPPQGQWDDRGGQWDRDDGGRWEDPRDPRDPRWQGGGRGGKRDDKRR